MKSSMCPQASAVRPVSDDRASQNHSCLDNTGQSARDDLAENQAVAVNAGNQDLYGPVALFRCHRHRNHLSVENNQKIQEKYQYIGVPVILSAVLARTTVCDCMGTEYTFSTSAGSIPSCSREAVR